MKQKIIVTTTINPPTQAIYKFLKFKDWQMIVIGDLKTPHDAYLKLEKKHKNLNYISPEMQENKYKQLSNLLGWNNIQRRNMGLLEARHRNADVIATVDDDNIPFDTWGSDILIDKEVSIDIYEPATEVFDPLSITEYPHLWHRGYPLTLIPEKNSIKYLGKQKRLVLIQADLWNGDPDVDAIARISFHPEVNFTSIKKPFGSNKISPFNSQNTFISGKLLPYYIMFPFIGRMDDIWGSYYLQNKFPNSLIYNKASVYQDRNVHDYVKDMENELIGYRQTLQFIRNLDSIEKILPTNTMRFFKLYQKEMNKII